MRATLAFNGLSHIFIIFTLYLGFFYFKPDRLNPLLGQLGQYFISIPYENVRKPHRMVIHTQTFHRQQLTDCLNLFDHFVKFSEMAWRKSPKNKKPHLAFTCSKLTIETLEQGVKDIQS